MNRSQIIAKTLVEMQAYMNPVDDTEPANANRIDENDRIVFIQESEPGSVGRTEEYDRDVFIPEMQKRLPEGEIVICDDLMLDVACCPPCHGFYPHYDMYMVELPDGRAAWICCAVRGVLFPETAIAGGSPEALELMGMIGGGEPKEEAASQRLARKAASMSADDRCARTQEIVDTHDRSDEATLKFVKLLLGSGATIAED